MPPERGGNAAREATLGIRLATALQYADRHAEAERIFLATGDLIDRHVLDERRDFWAQHFAKCLVEMGRAREALPLFQLALRLREVKGDPELLHSTRRALAALRDIGSPGA